MNTEQMIAQATAIIENQPGYSYNPAKLAEIINNGEIPENVCLCSVHSFPTRRSSDLEERRVGKECKIRRASCRERV